MNKTALVVLALTGLMAAACAPYYCDGYSCYPDRYAYYDRYGPPPGPYWHYYDHDYYER